MPVFDKNSWDRVSREVDVILTLDDPARVTHMAALTATDPELAALVADFLSRQDSVDATAFLSPAHRASLTAQPAPSLEGAVVGNYELVRRLGRGGMGDVWLGRRNDGRFEGMVAVKLLGIALMGGDGESRFRREGSILARLSHPHIAQLRDAGITAAGQPYLVLDYVDGEKLDDYCDQRTLPPDVRIRLVLQVLDAVSHAHANLVIHRDLKPANILVTAAGDVKLLDFGIATLSDPDPANAASATNSRALTPEYAAPEQILGDAITTSTDIYAVGALLFRLLAGRHPTAEGAATQADMLRAILEREPQRLSDAVRAERAAGTPSAHDVAAKRSGTPEKLVRTYRGDLDNIVMHALQRDPARRYQTAADMAKDLRAFLGHGVVSVRADSVTYRVQQFVRRNRVGVAAVGMVIAALLTATVVSRRQMRIAQDERDRAQLSARFTQAVGDIQLRLLTTVDSADNALTPNERLAQAQQQLAATYRNDPPVYSALLAMLGDRYGQLNDLARQSELQLLAAEQSHIARAARVEAQQRCVAAWAMYRSDRSDSASQQLDLATALLRTAPTTADPGAAVACNTAAAARFSQQQQYDSAIARLRGSVVLLRTAGDSASNNMDVALNSLSLLQNQAGRPRDGAATSSELQRVLLRKGQGMSEGYFVVAGNLVAAFLNLGEFAEARRVLDVERKKIEAPGRETTLPIVLQFRALQVAHRLGDADMVIRYARPLLEKAGKQLPSAITAEAYASLGEAYVARGDIRSAQRTETALESLLSASEKNPRNALLLAMLSASLSTAKGNQSTARAALTRALSGAGYVAGAKPASWMAIPLLRASDAALAASDTAAAAQLARDARIAATTDSLSLRQSAVVGDALRAESRAALAGGGVQQAAELAQRSLVPLAAGYGAASPQVAAARASLVSQGGSRSAP